MIATSVSLGILVSFLLSEVTGFLAGGLVVPGYLALHIEKPLRILVTLLSAGASFLVVKALSTRIILFGRRRFMAFVLTGMLISWAGNLVLGQMAFLPQDMRAIGYIVPGLIANDAWKQGFWKTCLFCLITAVATRLLLIALG